ncbi:hypothetical protein A3A46_02060 [Candidatus Roizmanbacteria bacterium RIFCSPLOWO2_01_FULL_37_13]|uniref:Glycosyltransferase 2-like domain-containing protein n=1 Tax=Candidatus Roizmanbacteria bacterium RIFCSPHIGHO2_02_FULL_38_11 TaxID=1802039 RepID=A0A1F7GXM4_9BACT|nr:MAG: hypothetical protein A3C25_00965 [Candidatus Roizmanbacteria bacterium RIFCSPHIGHO2_02_FULL_38_11]OGK35187.1 MAG: hypothetical protein A3F58_03860 [Candidatus Roizmanbacteria bacterium RIFCSPHIGHO2_12_FULL_37_9b]OGK42869.1 MAG: hypothetical protein A3A46_02060 [Candidatus Roizmanbacteria bacterium RIFCSPLOWO2_01_FULL_37_13]
MQPFFSIIIPTLNEELFVNKILGDLAKQKVKNFELIVVDGNSQDKTQQMILSYKKEMPITLLKMNPPNLPLQKNLGAKQAKSPYLLFLDADMSVSPSFTGVAERLIKKKQGLVFQPYVFPLEKGDYQEFNAIYPFINKLIEFSQNFNKPFSAGPAMFWERKAFLTIGGFDNIFGEDHQIIRKAHNWGIRPKFLSRLKVLFSLRRMKKEGRLLSLYKLLYSHLYLLFNEKMKKKIITYEMGGHLYKHLDEQRSKEDFIPRIKKIFRSILLEQ